MWSSQFGRRGGDSTFEKFDGNTLYGGKFAFLRRTKWTAVGSVLSQPNPMLVGSGVIYARRSACMHLFGPQKTVKVPNGHLKGRCVSFILTLSTPNFKVTQNTQSAGEWGKYE